MTAAFADKACSSIKYTSDIIFLFLISLFFLMCTYICVNADPGQGLLDIRLSILKEEKKSRNKYF